MSTDEKDVFEIKRPKGFNPKKIVLFSLLGLILIIVAFASATSFFTVSEQERAVVTTFGKTDPSRVYGAGLHFKTPFVQNVHLVNVTTRGMELGYKNVDEQDVSLGDESVMITKDFNFVLIDFYIEWKVSDPIKYLYSAESPEDLLRNIVQSSARGVVSGYDVDEVLTTAKGEIQTKVKELVSEKLDEYDIGIMISNITVQDAEPPTEQIIAAFKDVENAKQQKDTEINKANQYSNTNIPFARSEADRLIKEAESMKESRVFEAEGQVSRFNEMYKEYELNKEVSRTRMYLETMEEILPSLKVIIENDSSTMKFLDLTKDSKAVTAE